METSVLLLSRETIIGFFVLNNVILMKNDSIMHYIVQYLAYICTIQNLV